MKKAMSLVSLLISAAFACPALSASPHGLDDSNTTGSHGYDVHSNGEAFLKDNWPKSAVWQQIWGLCDDKHCDGSFSISYEWPVCTINPPPATGNTCRPRTGNTTVTVTGQYDHAGWDVRDDFMNDLLEHQFGDGGVYNNGDAGWSNGLGYPPGWWVASNTWIRHSGNGFWVNIQIQ